MNTRSLNAVRQGRSFPQISPMRHRAEVINRLLARRMGIDTFQTDFYLI